ncbi:hypothetical protein BGLT_02210 [Caballeronia glathei]|uniref:Uncharacterized protein n=1 Tax=Caballeronia glathei TaxID=60547 RepID=A0A069PW76_9BURK|nr:hypothetical protein [Caballeronia glathei]KDR41606.1 hypothetical protein BG61_16995 [Caballeronia glathei]CDY79429.1 hypothetical protein BGLT_02210 [Caballeronia glathei]
MTAWEIVDDRAGVIVNISAAGRRKLEQESRIDRVISVHTAVLIGASLGLVGTFGALVIKQILGI